MIKYLLLVADRRGEPHIGRNEIVGITLRPQAKYFVRKVKLWDRVLEAYWKTWVRLVPTKVVEKFICVEVQGL